MSYADGYTYDPDRQEDHEPDPHEDADVRVITLSGADAAIAASRLREIVRLDRASARAFAQVSPGNAANVAHVADVLERVADALDDAESGDGRYLGEDVAR